MTILFFDTETTGFPVKGAPLDDPRQPRIVQLAMIEATDEGKIISQHSEIFDARICEGEDFVIPEQASAVHGISTEFSLHFGTPQRWAISRFMGRTRVCRRFVAHNAAYDMKMLKIAAARYGYTVPDLNVTCTMEASRDILKIPPTARMQTAGFTQYKNPKLEEAYHHFTGKVLEDAHDALVDTRACMEVFFALKSKGEIE
ncbi:3'-5' exonuclease [Parasaccharibacter sp. TMW 2.1888]|uniref:3'-5' exonuclease n=1 Tax=Parasaccharibacter sp. TMW 2.1888 TaxID=2268025 RepID=UPI00204E997F|nr:3'-5' exonuclease [Parasaccharibacter sp. TMW 2.1888]UPO80339.1 3'-5' exonuclease [Parasaccharibacter sp. TMW 2.1888]